jgi:hypothetical protein
MSSDWIDSNPFALARWAPDGSAQLLTAPVYNTGLAFSAVGANTTCDFLAGNGRFSYADTTTFPMIWSDVGGFARLTDFFTAAAVDFSGWTLTSVSKMSADGLTFAGVGINPSGVTETWIATIPAPGTVMAMGIGLIAVRRRRLCKWGSEDR